jgi:uncharacterized membrane-anchored protein
MNGRARSAIFWVVTLAVFATVNWLIAQKETTLREGRTMLLHLAPVDPRSLMQGDYMQLRYEMAVDRATIDAVGGAADGKLVVALDERGVARFVRRHNGDPLAPGEALLRFRARDGIQLGAESFFFEEGQAERYQGAKYGELKVDEAGNSILVGLRSEQLEPL